MTESNGNQPPNVIVLRLFSVQFGDTVIFELRNAKLRVLAPVQARRFRGQTNLHVQVGCGRWSIARIAGSSTSTIRRWSW